MSKTLDMRSSRGKRPRTANRAPRELTGRDQSC
jgi:hypothetical protein